MAKLHAGDFSDWPSYYRAYQAALATNYLIPSLRAWRCWREGIRILDVGCGEAGASEALARAGARVDGVEIDPRRAHAAASDVEGLRVLVADITDPSTLRELDSEYELVLYRDVLEHIPDVDAALRESVRRMGSAAHLLVIFPPYWSAFGGHQQTLRAARLGKLPFVHWLGPRLHRRLAGVDGADPDWQELLTIRRARLSLRGMSRAARRHGLRLVGRRDYLIRPSHRLRYGLPVLGAGRLGRLPLLGEVAVNGSYQLFERDA